MNVILTGISRGIGLALAREALTKGHSVLGFSRHPQASPELLALKERYQQQLQFHAVDLTKKTALSQIIEVVHWETVDIIFNNAGIYREDEKIEDFEESFLVNSLMPFFLTRSLFPKLQKSSRPVSVQLTSLMGSISENTSGGSYSYRASKSALNMLFKGVSLDHSWLISLLIHPGWVKTNMGGENAPTEASEAAAGIWRLVEHARPSDSGRFQDYRGKILPW